MFNFTEILDGVFAPGTDEYDAIKDTYDTITSSVPVIAAEARSTLVTPNRSRPSPSGCISRICGTARSSTPRSSWQRR